MAQPTQITAVERDRAAPRRAVGQAALTPLLDTLFLLLFSVLAASDGADASADVEEEVQLELPSVMDQGKSSASTGEAPVVIAIEANGAVTVAGATDAVESSAAFAASLSELPSGTVFEIRAHADARHAVVVEVLHGLREAGFLDVSLIANKRAPGADPSLWGSPSR